MKRIWIGVGLLTVVLALGIWGSGYQTRSHTPGSEELKRAAALAQEQDWEGALKLESAARERWRSRRHLTAAMTEHASLEQIEGLFAQLGVYGQMRDPLSFGAAAAELAAALEALAQSQQLRWWNLI